MSNEAEKEPRYGFHLNPSVPPQAQGSFCQSSTLLISRQITEEGLNELLPGTGIQSSQLLATVEYEDNISQSAEKGNPQSGEKSGRQYSLKQPQSERERLIRQQKRKSAARHEIWSIAGIEEKGYTELILDSYIGLIRETIW